ncbi:hypothetical protein D3C78_1189180 [compost metagenome]
MSRLKELTDYKNTIVQRLVGNQEICKAVFYQNSDFLEQPDVDYTNLLYSNIYPYDFVPSTDEMLSIMKTYIALSVTDYRKASGAQFKAGNVFVRVFTHKNLYRTDYDFLRVDYLVSKIDELLSGERGIGIGKLEFVGMKEYSINSDYMGTYLHYRPVDFS